MISTTDTLLSSPPSQGGVGGESPLPQYYRENYFSSDTIFYTEHPGRDYGVAGDPVPYTIRGDSLLSTLLIISFVVLVVSIAQSRRFIARQTRNFFYLPHNDADISETSIEVRFQVFLVVLSCLLLAIITYQYATAYVADTFVIDSNLALVSIFFGVFLAYMLLKALLYQAVNSVFFDHQTNLRWMKTQLFINAAEGVLLFPVTLLLVYFSLSLETALYYFGFLLLFVKILTFYKCWSIFFRQNGVYLQTFLYFCTLEIVPLLNLIGGILILIDNLKLNF